MAIMDSHYKGGFTQQACSNSRYVVCLLLFILFELTDDIRFKPCPIAKVYSDLHYKINLSRLS